MFRKQLIVQWMKCRYFRKERKKMSKTETFGDKLKECKKVKFLIEDAKSDFEISPETIKVIDISDISQSFLVPLHFCLWYEHLP